LFWFSWANTDKYIHTHKEKKIYILINFLFKLIDINERKTFFG